jgi:hypothetical protein
MLSLITALIALPIVLLVGGPMELTVGGAIKVAGWVTLAALIQLVVLSPFILWRESRRGTRRLRYTATDDVAADRRPPHGRSIPTAMVQCRSEAAQAAAGSPAPLIPSMYSIVAAKQQRDETLDAVMQGCMSKRGYASVVAAPPAVQFFSRKVPGLPRRHALSLAHLAYDPQSLLMSNVDDQVRSLSLRHDTNGPAAL